MVYCAMLAWKGVRTAARAQRKIESKIICAKRNVTFVELILKFVGDLQRRRLESERM